jgi:hypothetical protein
MKVYPDNKGMGKKQTKKKRNNEFNNSPPWRGAVSSGEGTFYPSS